MSTFFLSSDHLTFRTWRRDDFPIAWQLWGDHRVTKHLDARSPLSRAQVQDKLKQEIETMTRYQVQYWPMFLIVTNEFVGCCGLRPYDLDARVYELGFHVRVTYWGRGYATEAARCVIDHAFDSLGVSALYAGHHPANNASALLLRKLGFVHTHDELYEPTGLLHPSYRLELPA